MRVMRLITRAPSRSKRDTRTSKTLAEREADMEEAQAIAAEFIQSLDNLPAEVQHHLAEIRDRENKIAEIQSRIQPRMAAYLRHSTRAGGLTLKDAALPDKIAQEHDRIRELSEEKVASAERIVHLLSKAMGRLDVDLARAMDRTGEVPQDVVMGNTGGSRTPIEKLPESLRNALGTSESNSTIALPVAATTSGTATPHPPNKRRRMNSTAPTGSPAPGVEGPHVPASRSRLSVVHTRPASPAPRSRRATSELVKDADAEGEDDPDDPSGDPEDKTLYCSCRSLSYGKMIACDGGQLCQYQWFHLVCVGLQDPLPNTWFCPDCVKKYGPALLRASNANTGTGAERRRRGRK
ncbi:hypothetical protein K439DRAFT_23398 [Ramaria rubella]|nr:hypothetical protein K439DRAFT_23398 [Ramaria rubella]